MMKPAAIRDKFGDDYVVDERTFIMGIDKRFTTHIAERFSGYRVLETCTGAGFTTISLAQTAKSVTTVEIDKSTQQQAISNVTKAGLADKVSFIHGSIIDQKILNRLDTVNAAFLDPDWAVTGPNHNYRFRQSNTQPPADQLLDIALGITANVAIVLPPFIDVAELRHLPSHEREKLFLGHSHELYCLYFGELIKTPGQTEFCIT